MSPIKNTNKMRQLRALVASVPSFKGIDLSEPHWTNEDAIALAYSSGYSWSAEHQVWWLSPQRVSAIAARQKNTDNHGNKGKRVIVRIMGPLDVLAQKAGDFAEVADLIGLTAVSISEAKRNDDNSSWGRIYITCEVL